MLIQCDSVLGTILNTRFALYARFSVGNLGLVIFQGETFAGANINAGAAASAFGFIYFWWHSNHLSL